MKNTIKIISLALALLTTMAFTACNKQENVGGEGTDSVTTNPGVSEESVLDGDLSDIMQMILEDVEELPMVMELPLDSENFSFYTFTDYIDGATGIASEAAINAIAHSAVLVRLPDGADVEAFAKAVLDNANPRKWVCVEAEKVIVTKNGNLVLLVMSDNATAEAISGSFRALK